MLESEFQNKLIQELKRMFKGCIVTKLDASHIQGIPDLLILYNDKWATLECKKKCTRQETTKSRILCWTNE